MKKLLYPIAFVLTAFLLAYSCSSEEEDNTPPPSVVKPTTPEPEPEPEVSQYTLTVTAGEGGTVSTEGGTYDEGTEVTITATPAEGYEFVGWEGNDSTEASLTVTLGANTTLNAIFITVQFKYLGEEYSQINKLTSHYINQKTNRYLSKDDVFNKINVRQNNPPVYWRTSVQNTVVDDFDKNGTLDVFGFWFKSTPDYAFGSVEPGKYFLYLDFFTDNPQEPISWDTEIVWNADLLLSDLNGDGQNEIISFNDNSHDARVWEDEGNIMPNMPTEIVSLDSNLNFSKSFVGEPIKCHDASLGDVDSDGDIDIVFFPFSDDNNKFPLLYRNDGTGNFIVENLFTNESLYSNYSNFFTLSYDVFDLNNDDNLDIIVSSRPNLRREEDFSNPPSYYELNQNIEIFWGNGTGNFDVDNKAVFNVANNFDYDLSVLGYGFSDYDLDGDVDIFITTTRAEEWRLLGLANVTEAVNSGLYYNNYVIYAFRNDDNIFNDVSEEIIDIQKDMSLTKYSNFYKIYFIDIDDDGDFDLVPGSNHIDTEFEQLKLLYWEKSGGKFIRRENY